MNAIQDMTLETLVARLADGDRAAFAPIFRLLWVPVFRLCTSILNNEADASDAAQEAMVKVLARASDYDPTRPVMPWALAIAAWECRTIARRRTRRREVPDESEQESFFLHAENDFIERDLARAALEAVGQLSVIDRETLMATFADEAANVSGATLRKRRERAVDRLRRTFKRLYGLD